MKLALTMMVRDEADIVGAMLEHHFAQGVSQAIVTDNGSIDGTWKILEKLSHRYPLDLRQDPVHRKQQSDVVTQMAREAHTRYGADWVINADADEFWLCLDRNRTLVDVFSDIDKALQSFAVPVHDMTGPPALRGTGLQRLILRDPRTSDELEAAGLLAPSTPNAAHIGSPDIVVAQGNHFVSLESRGNPPVELSLEVLHFPWRSWHQFARKVANAGRAYRANPELKPSPNHHGMRDFRRYEAGELLPHYAARSLDAMKSDVELRSRATLDRAIAETRESPVADRSLKPEEWRVLRELGQVLIDLERTQRALSITTNEHSGFLEAKATGLRLRSHYLRTYAPRRVRRLLETNPY
ncbi:glycosyltransferase family 2 protein [Leucobacter sp. W1153]|uniref:glycosyltransferase family 2 protein n=1 Tax=Leucobacter sp. W1153 TaxID=3439064 RepID=UPI003F310895